MFKKALLFIAAAYTGLLLWLAYQWLDELIENPPPGVWALVFYILPPYVVLGLLWRLTKLPANRPQP